MQVVFHFADVARNGSPICGVVRKKFDTSQSTLIKTRVNCQKCVDLMPKEKPPWG